MTTLDIYKGWALKVHHVHQGNQKWSLLDIFVFLWPLFYFWLCTSTSLQKFYRNKGPVPLPLTPDIWAEAVDVLQHRTEVKSHRLVCLPDLQQNTNTVYSDEFQESAT